MAVDTRLLEIIIDTREQSGKGWTFDPKQVAVRRATLASGDYSLLGLEDRVALERKSVGDLVSTVIHDWIRFRKELIRLSGYDLAAICVEANLEDILEHRYESEANPLSVIGRCNECFTDHGIPVLWWGDRIQAAVMAHRLLLMAWRRYGQPYGL